MESSTLVIKVKYGETLGRFNAHIDDKELCLDIIKLREKIISLFSFPTDSEHTLTYIDEDGDVVTLADEEDLDDIMRQSLNPLRITVSLNIERSGRSHGRSSGNSTPRRSPRVQTQILNKNVSEFVKSLPEVVRERLSRLSIELGSNGKSSQPGYTELLDSLSKMNLAHLKEDSIYHTKSGPSGSINDATVPKKKNYSKADGITPAAELKCNEADRGNLTGFSAGSVMHAADPADALHADTLCWRRANGCPVDKEIDIAVDFSAPEHPGRYISYWRMESPSGLKFGQRVWVLIQVDASLKDSFSKTVHGFNLNLPPVSSCMMSSQIENASIEPMIEDSLPNPDNYNRTTELAESVVDTRSNNYQELNFPTNDTLLVGGDLPNPAPRDASSLPTYPAVDFPKVEPIATSPALTSNTDVPSSVIDVGGKDEVELTLLKELEEMGFKQIDLNREILRMNEYNLEQSVDDLCGVEDWDPILKELQEMGFSDTQMNKMLLKKNNGSIKRVVMDLITGEKA